MITYLSVYHVSAAQKTECPSGTYSQGAAPACTPCDRGFTCSAKSTSPRPADGMCNRGGYCDGKLFHNCPAGTYNPTNGSAYVSACKPCPAGYYCLGPGDEDYSDKPCPEGHFCLVGSTSPTDFPCPGE